MHLSQSFHVVAMLAGVISHVMGALTSEQIVDDLGLLVNMVNAANSDASSHGRDR